MVGAAKHLREAVLELRTDVGRPIICVDLISQGRIPGSANGLYDGQILTGPIPYRELILVQCPPLARFELDVQPGYGYR
jgi:hypothetical protein